MTNQVAFRCAERAGSSRSLGTVPFFVFSLILVHLYVLIYC